jgi:autotransporter-associated beta strand protein
MNTTNSIIKRTAWLVITIGLTALPLRAADYYWDLNGNGAWDTSLTAAWATEAAGGTPSVAATAAADNVYFSADNITAGTITVAGNQLANNLYLNQAFNFTGGTIELSTSASGTLFVGASGTIGSALKTKGIYFSAANQTLTLTGSSTNFSVNGDITGASAEIKQASTVILHSGTYAMSGNLNLNIGDLGGSGGLIIESGARLNTSLASHIGYGGNGLLQLNGGYLYHSGYGLLVGRGGGNTGRLIVNNGTLQVAGNNYLMVADSNANGTVDIRGGYLDIVGLSLSSRSNANNFAVVNIDGGTINTGIVTFGTASSTYGNSSAGSGTLTMNGGVLNIGAGGIINGGGGTFKYAANLNGGTVGATAAWSSDLQMTLGTTATTSGITFDTTGGNITLSGVLDGDGSLTKAGTGTLLLSGANTYEGDTIVDAGTLELGNAAALGIEADLSLLSGVTVNLNYTGIAEIDHLLLDGVIIDNLIVDTAYNATDLNAALGSIIFGGNGLLTISAIPEPSAWLLLAIGAGVLAISRRCLKNSKPQL